MLIMDQIRQVRERYYEGGESLSHKEHRGGQADNQQPGIPQIDNPENSGGDCAFSGGILRGRAFAPEAAAHVNRG